MTDSIEQPAHYDFGMMEAREIIELAVADFRDPTTIYHVASALKYLLRASRKNGADDIAKARKHVGWAEDAARAYEKRIAQADRDFLAVVSDLEFRHGDIDTVCGLPTVGKAQPGMGIRIADMKPLPPREAGEFAQPPNCSPGVSESRVHESPKSNERGHVETVDSTHPMAAEGLRLADEQTCNQPRRSESAWSVAWPSDAPRESAASITEYQTLVGN